MAPHRGGASRICEGEHGRDSNPRAVKSEAVTLGNMQYITDIVCLKSLLNVTDKWKRCIKRINLLFVNNVTCPGFRD
jgi:hypothetical protein